MAFGDESERLVARLRDYLANLTDDHTRLVVSAWARAWDDLSLELLAALDEIAVMAGDGRVTRSMLNRSQRLQIALATIEARLDDLVDDSGRIVIDQLGPVVNQSGRMVDQLIASQLPAGERVSGWTRVDPDQVDAIVERTTQRITAASLPIAPEAAAVMRRELVRGMLVGANPREAARRMVSRSESIFNGGLARAMTIARTEMLDAQRAASMLGEQQNTDLLAGWTWVASLGPRTCPSCWAMHGREFDLDEPGPLDHRNGRCARVPRTKTWRELGFDVDEPPSLIPPAGDQFDALSPVEQLQVLGPSRYAAWQAGEFPMTAWASKRSTTGWRDSYIPAKSPSGFKGARSATVLGDQQRPYRFGRGVKALGPLPKQTLQAIGAIHKLPMSSSPLTLLPMTVTEAAARPGLQGYYRPGENLIRIRRDAIGKGLTTAHEFGHYLDHRDFGAGQSMASQADPSPVWVALRKAFDASPEVRAIRAAAADPTHPYARQAIYLGSYPELFGRAYAQWIAVRTGRKNLNDDVQRLRQLPGIDANRQWSDKSFGPIASALDAVFGSRLNP